VFFPPSELPTKIWLFLSFTFKFRVRYRLRFSKRKDILPPLPLSPCPPVPLHPGHFQVVDYITKSALQNSRLNPAPIQIQISKRGDSHCLSISHLGRFHRLNSDSDSDSANAVVFFCHYLSFALSSRLPVPCHPRHFEVVDYPFCSQPSASLVNYGALTAWCDEQTQLKAPALIMPFIKALKLTKSTPSFVISVDFCHCSAIH
jgi:hypothetical protein